MIDVAHFGLSITAKSRDTNPDLLREIPSFDSAPVEPMAESWVVRV